MLSVPLETRFAALTSIVRRRMLPVPGRLTVRRGDRVQPDDVVAEAERSASLHVIDVAEALRVDAERAARHMRYAPGQAVQPGDVLAAVRRLGVTGRQVRAPAAGVVESIHRGLLFLREEPAKVQVRAHIPGEVVVEYPTRGVAIRTTGCRAGAAWGSGPESRGALTFVTGGPAEPLPWDRVTPQQRGAVIVAGTVTDPRALYRAARLGVSGLVLGSLPPQLQRICPDLTLTVVVTEGIGTLPMAEPIFQLLHSYEGLPAALTGAGEDPELIVPLPAEAEANALPEEPMQVGRLVRITRPPHQGAIGELVSLPAATEQMGSGARAAGAIVRLPDGRRERVPLANLEILE